MVIGGFIIYILLILIGYFYLPLDRIDPYARDLVFLIGFIGVWRYGWFFNNAVRAWIYRKSRFPAIRKAEQDGGEALDPDHVFLLITTFRIGTEVSVRTYRAAVKDAIACGYDVTIIASLVEMSEERLVRKIFAAFNPPDRVKLIITRIKGTGKRDALAAGFRVVANANVDRYRSVVAVIDGDSVITPGLIRKCARLFALNENLGGLTTDEDEEDYLLTHAEGISEKIYYYWYKMRFAQRNISMSSLSLSNKILTLTGRMSMIRANIVAKREFVETVQADRIGHWRLGEFYFLTGDDKSSWFDVVRDGWELWYVPDVMVTTVDEIPDRNFFKGSLLLMTRWFGNQYRTNSRALKLPISRMGLYPWYALLDQRITKWTTLFGLFTAIFGSIQWGWGIFAAYIWWMMLTRLLMTFTFRFSRKEILPIWPLYLYYNQVVGSIVKIYVWEHLYKQKWTRQKTTLKKGTPFLERYRRLASDGMVAIDWLVFLTAIAFLVQLIDFDDVWMFMNLFGS